MSVKSQQQNMKTIYSFPALFEQAYPDKESAMLELKNKHGEYLPDSFDYDTKFVYFIGTAFG